ncbi:MAG: PEGA domain-containing protein [Candidatus Microsaccharimonas sp.]
MFKRPTKKQQLIQRIIFSGIATLSVLIILTVTILFMLGYRLNSDNGKLSQGALLQFDSTPNNAAVWIDGKNTGVRTAGKQTVEAGVHAILFQKDSYEDWSRTLDFAAGTLTWLDYARLVPKERTPEKVAHYQALVAAKASPDMKFYLLQEAADQPVFQLADLRAAEVKFSSITLPTTLYSDAATAGVTHAFTLDDWNSGGRYILVKHAYKDQTEWLMVDTENAAQSVNITRLLSVNLQDVQFAGTNGRTLFGLADDGNIRKLDLSSATLSRALVSNVESFNVFDTTIVSYVGLNPADTTKRVAGVYRDGDEVAHVLRQVAATDISLKIITGRYFNDDYVAIAEGKGVTILKGSYPTSSADDTSSLKKFATMTLTAPATQLTFSPKSDYVLAESGTEFVSYEIEHLRSASGSLDANEGAAATALRWLDIAHVWNQQNGQLVMRDFDNSNVYAINAITGEFDATLSQNGRFFYSIGRSDENFTLQRVKMILD